MNELTEILSIVADIIVVAISAGYGLKLIFKSDKNVVSQHGNKIKGDQAGRDVRKS